MGPNFWGKQLSVISKKKRQQPSIKKVTIARPHTSQQSDTGLLTRVSIDYSLHPKYLHLLTSVLHIWPFVLLKNCESIIYFTMTCFIIIYILSILHLFLHFHKFFE
jgi:hypothetical protein